MRLYSTDRGIARGDGDKLEILDLPFADVGALLRESSVDAASTAGVREVIPLADATITSLLGIPGKVLIIGLNFTSHSDEVAEAMGDRAKDRPMPTGPLVYIGPGSAAIAPGAAIVLPASAPDMVDYEGEVGAVIGRTATAVSEADAWSHLAGLTCLNDVSARDRQMAAFQDRSLDIALAKSFDTFKPMGPCLTTADEYSEPLDIQLRTWVNGELRQDAQTTEFYRSISQLIAHISSTMTLHPGDVICTGSPRGVGSFKGQFLRPGDVVEIEVEGVGRLSNPVVAAS